MCPLAHFRARRRICEFHFSNMTENTKQSSLTSLVKRIRRMRGHVWVEPAPGFFYCSSSREALCSLPLCGVSTKANSYIPPPSL